jgi:hypothetical protein
MIGSFAARVLVKPSESEFELQKLYLTRRAAGVEFGTIISRDESFDSGHA